MFAERYCYVRPAHLSSSRNRKDLLWPVYAWKVLYPDERRRSGLNLFQETLLGLMRAGMRDVDELARSMALDPELVRFIVAVQLQPNGWLDSGFTVTQEGERLLDGAEDVRRSLQVGYAFQDAVSGDWIPRFTTLLPEIVPTNHDSNNRPMFVLDRDSGYTHRPFVLKDCVPPALVSDRLMRAHRQYRKDVGASGREWRDADTEVVFDNIECIDDKPTKMYLWCELYRDESGIDRWLISDPFRIRRAVPWLRKPFVELAKGNTHVAKLMQDLLPDLAADGLSAQEWIEAIEESVNVEIDANYPYLKSETRIRDHLSRVLRLTEQIDVRERAHPEELGALMTESANLIESVLQWLLREWKAQPPAWPRNSNWSFHEAKAELGALRIGCAAIDPKLINLLAGQGRTLIERAMMGTSQALKALLAATLFAANERDDHPFHELAPDTLQLTRLPRLADYRNKVGGHASGEQADRNETLDHAKFAVTWMALFNRLY